MARLVIKVNAATAAAPGFQAELAGAVHRCGHGEGHKGQGEKDLLNEAHFMDTVRKS